MPSITSLFICFVAASTAVAHFTLDYPATRGPFVANTETEFCGGFPNVASVRQPYPLAGTAPVWFNSHHGLATIGLLISPIATPTSFSNFTSINGSTIPFAKSYFQAQSGSKCFNMDLSSISPGLALSNGSLVTVQMQYSGGDGSLWQCADLILIDQYTAPANWTCTSDVSALSNATATFTPSIGVASMTHSMASGTASAAASASASAVSSGEKLAFGGALGGLMIFLVAASIML